MKQLAQTKSKHNRKQKQSLASVAKVRESVLSSIVQRAKYLIVRMIYEANNRDDKQKGDPKVGGHPAASTSSLSILSALHLVVKSGFDHIAVKPHASPADHSLHYLLNLLLDRDLKPLPQKDQDEAMYNLRKFSQNGEPVFQSYHSSYDPDHHNFFPSGTVGIPPVNAGYMALAYRFAQEHGYEVPEGVHFWALIGDSEFREGSLYEALPDFAERQLGNLTWIVDYNRQSLDGHRITNKEIMGGTDALRLERTARANGWDVIQVQHGQKRQALFQTQKGFLFKKFLEDELEDLEFQSYLLISDAQKLKEEVLKNYPYLKPLFETVNSDTFKDALHDLGGHDINALIDALEKSKQKTEHPCLIIAHTIKGWGISHAATPGNHSSLVSRKEIDELMKSQGLVESRPFEKFAENSEEGKFLKVRHQQLLAQIQEQQDLKEKNTRKFLTEFSQNGGIPDSLGINLKMVHYPHTQWMLGQLTAKLTRISNTSWDKEDLKHKQKPLTNEEKAMKLSSELLVSMAPDVGTSTNLNSSMDGKVFGALETDDYESDFNVKDIKVPDLIPGKEISDRFLRFEIAEGNVMSCMGSFGRMRDVLGIPLLPLTTVYDFFVKRAHDQYFYNLYWNSSFILVGTPSGVSLSPEGAQHGWKSDFQIPNQIIWEPYFCQELDWIFCDALKRHITSDNQGRSGVYIRGSTRGVDEKEFLKRLRGQKRFVSCSDKDILKEIRNDVLSGAYYLLDYRGYEGYEPGDNVVHIFAMGALGTEALKASDILLEQGIYANVIMVTSPDLLLGHLAYKNDYHHLKQKLQIDGTLHLKKKDDELHTSEVRMLSGDRVPIVSVHDGEPGLLDNIGSIIGVQQEALAVRQHSKCGRPSDVFKFHGIDAQSIVESSGKVLSNTALESVSLSASTIQDINTKPSQNISSWRDLWPYQRKS